MSKLLDQVAEIRRKARTCTKCKGTGIISACIHHLDGVDTEVTECWTCGGTGHVPAPDIDALCKVIETLAQAVEAEEEAIEDHGSLDSTRDEDTIRQSWEAAREAHSAALALLRDGVPEVASDG